MGQLTLREIVEILNAAVISDVGDLEVEIHGVCSADLMSDVLFYTTPNSILLTGLIQPQAVKTAEITGIKGIIFTRGKQPDKETVELARRKKIPLFTTSHSKHIASGKLFAHGLENSLEE